MATSDLTIKIHADTSEFEKSLRRVRRRLWWTAINNWLPFLVVFVLGIAVGFVLGGLA